MIPSSRLTLLDSIVYVMLLHTVLSYVYGHTKSPNNAISTMWVGDCLGYSIDDLMIPDYDLMISE